MTDSEDYMARLPIEVSSYILSFLDLKTLLACSAVNKVWDDITKHVCSKAWHKACLKAGIYVKQDKYKEGKDWKDFVFSTQNRIRDIWDPSVVSYEFDEAITAMCCHNEKVAVAFSDRIQIWKLPDNESVGEFECKFEPFHLKFEDDILVAASRSGVFSCWSLPSGNQLWYHSHDNGILTDFDFLNSRGIVVGSFFQNDIPSLMFRIWNSASSSIRKIAAVHPHKIEKVMLVSQPAHPVCEQEKICFLFCLTAHYVRTSRVIAQDRKLYVLWLISISLIPYPLPITQRVAIEKPAGGLQFDGETLYISIPTRPACSSIIWAWNSKTNSKTFIEISCPITRLLGVGEKYLVFEIRPEDDSELVIALDKFSQETISQFTVPRRTDLNRDDYLCLGNTSWLDSINGESNSGVVYASITDDRLGVYVRWFVPRT